MSTEMIPAEPPTEGTTEALDLTFVDQGADMLPQLNAGVLAAHPKVAGLVNPRRTGTNDVPDTARVIGVESDAIRQRLFPLLGP